LSVKKSPRKNGKNRFKKGGPQAPARAGRLLRQWLKASFVLFLFCLLGVAYIFVYDVVTQCEYFRADLIEVRGGRRLSGQEIRESAGVEKGSNILAVNLSMVRKRLLANPWVKAAAVAREFPACLRIRVQEHRPVAVLDVGRLFLIGEEGAVFKEADPEELSGLPIISGLEYSDWEETGAAAPGIRSAAMALLEVLANHRNRVYGSRVQEISVDPDIGLSIRFGDPSVRAVLGYGSYARKLRQLSRVLAHVDETGAIPSVQKLDASNPKRIIATPADPNTREANKEV
jgi:cell division protein FtsQ